MVRLLGPSSVVPIYLLTEVGRSAHWGWFYSLGKVLLLRGNENQEIKLGTRTAAHLCFLTMEIQCDHFFQVAAVLLHCADLEL